MNYNIKFLKLFLQSLILIFITIDNNKKEKQDMTTKQIYGPQGLLYNILIRCIFLELLLGDPLFMANTEEQLLLKIYKNLGNTL